jgi:hypothetical protein
LHLQRALGVSCAGKKKGPARRAEPFWAEAESVLFSNDIVRSLSLLLFLDFESHLIPLQQHIPEPGILHTALVEEDILTVRVGDKPESLCGIEELHRSFSHVRLPFIV